MKREAAYYEKDFESAIITHLQDFLLELGNGFSFVARQKRIHLEGDEFFADLVFYNRLLQCFVIIEIKTHKLTHQDIGQLQMYVNYYDRNEKMYHENATIGMLLCADKQRGCQIFVARKQSADFRQQIRIISANRATVNRRNDERNRTVVRQLIYQFTF